jgi:hypothetical protein
MSILVEVVGHMKEWKPGDLPRELDYHKSLEAFLRTKYPNGHIEREYRHSGTTVDLYLAREGWLGRKKSLFVEAKRNLVKKTEYDRLVGQVMAIGPGSVPLIVALCGRADRRYIDRFQQQFKKFMEDDFLGDEQSMCLFLTSPPS